MSVPMRIVFVLFLAAAAISGVGAQGISEWPQGWSELHSVASTGVYGNRFVVLQDDWGTVMVTIDGVHYDHLRLNVRGLDGQTILWESTLSQGRRINYPALVLGSSGERHLLWQERDGLQQSLHYAVLDSGGLLQQQDVLTTGERIIQDIAAVFHDQQLHLVWVDNRRGSYNIFHGVIGENGLAVEAPLAVTAAVSVQPALVSFDGSLVAAWVERDMFQTTVVSSRLGDDGWTEPLLVGPATSFGGEVLRFLVAGDTLELLWTAVAEGGVRSMIYAAPWGGEDFGSWRILRPGSRVSLLPDEPVYLVWQDTTAAVPQVNVGRWQEGQIEAVQLLNVRRNPSMRPEIVRDAEDQLHVYWVEATESGHQLMTINTREPRQWSWLRSIGIDDQAPVFHLSFVFLGSFALAAANIGLNLAVLLLALAGRLLLQRWPRWRAAGIVPKVLLSGALLALLLETPLAFGAPPFFGLGHYLLSVFCAFAVSGIFLRLLGGGGDFEPFVTPLLWLFWYQLAAFVPEIMAMI